MVECQLAVVSLGRGSRVHKLKNEPKQASEE